MPSMYSSNTPSSISRKLIDRVSISFTAILLIAIYATASFYYFHKYENRDTSLEYVLLNKKLIVLTTNQPSTYYIGKDEQAQGPEYSLTQKYARSLNVDVEYKVFESTDDVLQALANGEGDIAAASLTITEERQKNYLFSESYLDISEYLICHRSIKKLGKTEDLKTKDIVVAKSSSYIESVSSNFPNVSLSIIDNISSTQILENVHSKKTGCTISDSHIFDLNRRYYPELAKNFVISEGKKVAWILHPSAFALQSSVNNWLSEDLTQGFLKQHNERHYGHIDAFDYVDIQKFRRRIETRLPKYKKTFSKAAEKFQLSETLLISQSYQESHWNPRAKSFTGVRGIMMLTLPVAKSLGVKSRLNAKENIIAGAKYFSKLKNIFDEEVIEPDRTWMTLAAYNVGRGHFKDAQNLAEKLGKSPNKWSDMKEVLPLLSQKDYYKDLRYGYARGNEPVKYVQRIREYEKILSNIYQSKEEKIDHEKLAEPH